MWHKAAEHYRFLAEASELVFELGFGNPEYQYKIGECYKFGKGVNEDKVEAIKWYRRAAEKGNAKAQWRLGEHYYNGDGLDKNYEEAIKWYSKAAEQGDRDARRALNELHFRHDIFDAQTNI